MTSALMSLKRWTRATEDDYKGENLQKNHTEHFFYHLQRFPSHSCIWESKRKMVLEALILTSETQFK